MSKQQQLNNNQKKSKYHFTSIKWYWWLLIIFIIWIFAGGLSIAFGNGQLISDVSKSLLGFAEGILNVLENSWLAWIFAISLLAPFLLQASGSLYSMYKAHFGEGKKDSDLKKELEITRDDLQKTIDDIKNKNPDISKNDLIKEAIKESVNKMTTKFENSLNNQESQASDVAKYNEIAKSYNDKIEEIGKDNNIEDLNKIDLKE